MQMTFARGVAASLVMFMWINKDIGNVLFGQVQASCWPSLIFRCAQGALSLFNGFLLLKYFYVSTITIVCALTPIFTVILAYFIFGSQISPADIRALIAIFVAVGLILTGGNGTSSGGDRLDTPNAFILLILFS